MLQNQNQVSKTDFRLVTSSVTSVTKTINMIENGDMPQRFISTKESSYKEDKSPTETINNQTDATSTMATDHDAKPVDVKGTRSTPQLVISNDGRDPKSTFQQASSRIEPTSHAGLQESRETIRLPSNGNDTSIPDVYKSRSSPPNYNHLIAKIQEDKDKQIVELKQKVQKHEDERDNSIQREKDKLQQDKKALEIKEEEFEQRMKEERKQLQDDFNLKRRNSEIELQDGIKKQKIEFEKQEKKQKRDSTAEKKKISITEKELDKKKERLKLLEAHLDDERMKLDKEKRWVIHELNTKKYKLRKRHKKKRRKSKRRRDEQEPVRKGEERVHKSSRKVKDKREWFWDEDTVLQQRKKRSRKQRQNEENPRASVTNRNCDLCL